MTYRLKTLAVNILVLGASFFCCEQALAEKPIPAHHMARILLADLSLDEVTKKIRKRTKGKILRAKKIKKGDRVFYKIRVLLPNGKVKIFSVDPNKG